MSDTQSHSIWVKLERFPPVLVRLLARLPSEETGYPRAMTDEEIAARSDLSVSTVAALSRLTSWDDVSLRHLRAFVLGCGVDFADRVAMRRLTRYIAHIPSFAYLRKDAEWLKYRELMKLYVNHERDKPLPTK